MYECVSYCLANHLERQSRTLLPVHLVPAKYIGKLIFEPFLNLVEDHYCWLIELAALRLTTGVKDKAKQTRLPHNRPWLSTEQKESESRRNQHATFFL